MIGYINFDIDRFQKEYDKNFIKNNWTSYFYEKQQMYRQCKDIFEDRAFSYSQLSDLQNLVRHLSDINERLWLYYYDETACIIGYGGEKYVMDSTFVEPEFLQDYSRLTSSEIKALTGTVNSSSSLPVELENATVESVTNKKAEIEKNIEAVQAEIEAKEDEIRAEMMRKIDEMKAAMEVKVADLNSKLEQFQNEIFVLESQIYTIRCYTGEVVKFHQIREGAFASEEEPLVLYQKIRYLDEELGKHIGIFDFDGEDDNRLLSVLKHRDGMANLLAPGNKSLTVLRTSRTGKFIAASDAVNNCLTEYDQYHGDQLALLLRNGENLYIAWCDADNIKINEENVFYSASSSYEMIDDDTKDYEIKTDIKVALSRYYLLAVIQGLIDSKNIISFPEPVNMAQMNSKYVIYSFADGWITTNKYGTFKELLELSKNITPRKGDKIVTILGLSPEKTQGYSAFINDRGIGSKNRTHDVSVPGKKIYPINTVLYDMVYEFQYEAIKVTEELGSKKSNWIVDGVPTVKEEPTILYNRIEEVLFKDKSKTTINFENARELKEKNVLDYVISQMDAIGSKFHVGLYYKENGQLKKHVRWSDRSFYNHSTEPELSGLELFEINITGVKLIEKYPHTFISLEQYGYGSYANDFKETKYNVNFEIMDDEYLRTTFLCSSWINEVITNSNIGHLHFPGATPSFADMLPYLHLILDEVKQREEVEKELLITAGGQEYIDSNENWDVALCEWKIKNEIHELTPTRAKRFLNHYFEKSADGNKANDMTQEEDYNLCL